MYVCVCVCLYLEVVQIALGSNGVKVIPCC